MDIKIDRGTLEQLMGGIFTSVMPEMRSTLIQSMIVMSVSMGAFVGLPPSLIETYGSDIKKMVLVNKYVGLISLQYYQTIIAYIIDTMPIATVSNIAQ